MKTMKRQRGMTAIGWLFVLGMLAVLVMATLRLFPVYMDGMNIGTAVKSLQEDREPYSSVGDVRSRLERRLSINGIDFLGREEVQISRDGDAYVVDVNYESRVPFMYNIDFVVSFSYSARAQIR